MNIPKEKFLEFLKKSASVVVADGEMYIYFPHWFRIEEKTNEIEVIDFEKLPEPLKKFIEDERNRNINTSINPAFVERVESFFTNVKTEN